MTNFIIPYTGIKRLLSQSIHSGERSEKAFGKIPVKERTGVREKHLPPGPLLPVTYVCVAGAWRRVADN